MLTTSSPAYHLGNNHQKYTYIYLPQLTRLDRLYLLVRQYQEFANGRHALRGRLMFIDLPLGCWLGR